MSGAYNITTLKRKISPKKVLMWSLAGPVAIFALFIMIALGVGFAQAIGSNHSPNQITIEKTNSMYDDCVTFANARGYSSDICESLTHTDKTVSSFNDGFVTSKQDDCQQGDAKACEWVKTND